MYRLGETDTPPERTLALTRLFEWGMRVGFALSPLIAIVYIAVFVPPSTRFIDFAFHEFAIAVATCLGAFISYVTWRCYRHSGEPFLLWVALGLTGFTVIYLPHGLLTRTFDCNTWLFILYGPFSRIVMALCLLVAMLRYGQPAHDAVQRTSPRPLRLGLSLFLLIDIAIAFFAYTPLAGAPWLRIGLESGAILSCLVAILIFLQRRVDSPLMWMYVLGLAAFAQSSLAFLLAQAWNHQWWLAHLVFAAGFFMLSYGVLQAFHTTRAFSTVYSQGEMMRRLQDANAQLARLAAYDALTGAANRRHLLQSLERELARSRRHATPLALLALDLDHFKAVNDQHGHPAGDAVLVAVVERMRNAVRLPDRVGRFGGEEFIIVLPESTLEQAEVVARRILDSIAGETIAIPGGALRVTASIGIAVRSPETDTAETLIGAADARLYAAKAAGRNRYAS